MIANKFRILSDEERARFEFEHCILCGCYPCEVVDGCKFAAKNYHNKDVPFYIQSGWDGCVSGINEFECGNKKVADGIQDHFKIELEMKYKKGCYRSKIVKGVAGRWEPGQWYGISAQTGQGKNWWIENVLLPYVRELNIKYNTDHKVLILSNRIALRLQIESRIKKGLRYRDSEREMIRNYKNYECAHVATYQGFLSMVEQLQAAQESELSSYIFVICDEAHFFTSDSMFNYDTGKILSTMVETFKKTAIRVYMSATPYDCFRYIRKHEGTSGVTYHFQRNYDYLDIKYYSHYEELEELIVESVNSDDENWLVFIDYIERCKKLKCTLEGYPDMEGKVFAVDADSKDDRDYQEMVYNEKLQKGTKVLISTSVLDNGVNFRNIANIVVSDISQVKVLQMLGRPRVEKGSRVTLYLKRFNAQVIENRIDTLHERQDNIHAYDLADRGMAYSDKFLDKFYHGSDHDWKVASHQFGREKDIPTLSPSAPNLLYYNEIARSYVDRLVPQYESILTEMRATDEGQKVTGQKYLEYQLTWFGKEYDKANDITLTGMSKSQDGLSRFLESHAQSGAQMFKAEQEVFRNEFTKLHDGAFPRRDKNLGRSYGLKVINAALDEHNLNYRVESKESVTPEGKRQYWTVVNNNRD